MLAYIIQTDLGLDTNLKNRCVTLDKEVAKRLIKIEILDSCYETPNEQEVERFAQDLVDGNTGNHDYDEFNGIRIWCDIVVFREQ